MRLLICIDDTDNLESRGTGSIASEMYEMIEENGWGKSGIITRHQLLIHDDVPYTSHNSSMCFDTRVYRKYYSEMKKKFLEYLTAEMAKGADPGICIINLDNIKMKEELIEFGYMAKREVLDKKQAYHLAKAAGVFLAEAGGTGDGVIGALAGVGLRLSGNDGEIKGGINHLKKGMTFTVDRLKKETLISEVLTLDFQPVDHCNEVTISWKAKPVLHDGNPVLIVFSDSETGRWITMEKNEMRAFGAKRASREVCDHFKPDVSEEMVSPDEDSCHNCAYRRWTENSFVCVRKERIPV